MQCQLLMYHWHKRVKIFLITSSSRSVSATPPPAPAPRLWAWPAASSPCQTCHREPCWSQPAIDNNSNNVSISEWERMYKLTWMCWQGCLGSGWKALPGMRARLRWRPRCITISQVLVRVGIWMWHHQIHCVPKKMSFLGKTAITTFKIIQNAKAGGVLENSGYLLPDEHWDFQNWRRNDWENEA